MNRITLTDEERDELEQLLLDIVYGDTGDMSPDIDILFDVLHKVENTSHSE